MDDATIDFILKNTNIDGVSGVPFASVVFMLYYGLELEHFLMKISDEFIEKYPLEQHTVGSSSVYLSGSAAQGLYLNTNYLPDARDIDIVTINRKYDIRERCHYKEPVKIKSVSTDSEENHDENEHICPKYASENLTVCDSEDKYLNVMLLPDTPPGYVLLQKCRQQPLPVQTLDDQYVSSMKVSEVRAQYWRDLKPFVRQWFEKQNKYSTCSLFSFIEPHGPASTAYMSGFESTTPFEVDIVFCIPYPLRWPKIAEEWLERKRPSGWPPQKLIDEIYNDGCTLIPRGSVGSPMEDYEWRISFTGDLKLSRSLTRVQRELLHILKAIISGGQMVDSLTYLVTSIESYQFMNLLYYEIEQTDQDRWRRENVAELLFHILDKFCEHFQNLHMSHFFIQSRNIFEKYKTMSEEEKDAVLYTVQRIRRDPLGQLLQQQKYLRISPHLYKMVFSPFVEHVKTFGAPTLPLYVNTLVRLSKAHILEGSYLPANTYALQALQFYNKANAYTFPNEDYIDLMFTVAISYHFVGYVEHTLETIEKIMKCSKPQCELIKVIGQASYVQLLVIYARTLSLSTDTHSTKSETVKAKIKHLYKEAREKDPSDLSVSVDMLNTFLHLEDIEEIHSTMKDISSQFPELNCPISEHDNTNWKEKDNTEVNTIQTIYDRAEYMRSKQETANTPVKDDGNHFTQTMMEFELQGVQSQTSYTNFVTHFQENDPSLPGDQDNVDEDETSLESSDDSSDETCAESSDDSSDETCTRKRVKLTDIEDESQSVRTKNVLETQIHDIPKAENEHISMNQQRACDSVDNFNEVNRDNLELIYDRQSVLNEEDDENIQLTSDDMDSLDSNLFADFCKIKAFEDISMHTKAAEITKRLKKKLTVEKGNGNKVSMKMLEAAYDMFYPQQETAPTDDVFHDILSKDNGYMVYSRADVPLLDEQLACVFHRDGSGVIQIPANVAFLNVMIRFLKTDRKVSSARKCLSQMESFIDDSLESNDKSDSRYLLACHLEWFAEIEAAKQMFIESRKLSSSVKEQVFQWCSQMFSIVKTFEPKNKFLDEIFDV